MVHLYNEILNNEISEQKYRTKLLIMQQMDKPQKHYSEKSQVQKSTFCRLYDIFQKAKL